MTLGNQSMGRDGVVRHVGHDPGAGIGPKPARQPVEVAIARCIGACGQQLAEEVMVRRRRDRCAEAGLEALLPVVDADQLSFGSPVEIQLEHFEAVDIGPERVEGIAGGQVAEPAPAKRDTAAEGRGAVGVEPHRLQHQAQAALVRRPVARGRASQGGPGKGKRQAQFLSARQGRDIGQEGAVYPGLLASDLLAVMREHKVDRFPPEGGNGQRQRQVGGGVGQHERDLGRAIAHPAAEGLGRPPARAKAHERGAFGLGHGHHARQGKGGQSRAGGGAGLRADAALESRGGAVSHGQCHRGRGR